MYGAALFKAFEMQIRHLLGQRAAAEPGTVEASEALPAASSDFSAAALQQLVQRMLVAGGDGSVRSGWPACSAQVTNELVLNAIQAVLAVFLVHFKWNEPPALRD